MLYIIFLLAKCLSFDNVILNNIDSIYINLKINILCINQLLVCLTSINIIPSNHCKIIHTLISDKCN